jgi:hypothetical protein
MINVVVAISTVWNCSFRGGALPAGATVSNALALLANKFIKQNGFLKKGEIELAHSGSMPTDFSSFSIRQMRDRTGQGPPLQQRFALTSFVCCRVH